MGTRIARVECCHCGSVASSNVANGQLVRRLVRRSLGVGGLDIDIGDTGNNFTFTRARHCGALGERALPAKQAQWRAIAAICDSEIVRMCHYGIVALKAAIT